MGQSYISAQWLKNKNCRKIMRETLFYDLLQNFGFLRQELFVATNMRNARNGSGQKGGVSTRQPRLECALPSSA